MQGSFIFLSFHVWVNYCFKFALCKYLKFLKTSLINSMVFDVLSQHKCVW